MTELDIAVLESLRIAPRRAHDGEEIAVLTGLKNLGLVQVSLMTCSWSLTRRGEDVLREITPEEELP